MNKSNFSLNKSVFHKGCNFCNSTRRKILFRFANQNLVRCKKCNLVYLSRQLCDFENLYGENYYAIGSEVDVANYADYKSQEKTMKRNFSFAYTFISRLAAKKRINFLEIGAGYGYFIKNLPDNVNIQAVEVSKNACTHLRSLGIKSYLGEITSLKIKTFFDVVAMFDVIEHQVYLKEYMFELHKLLKPNGYVIFTTPDFDGILNRLLGKNAPTIQPLYHNYYFSQNWIKMFLPEFGFKIISIHTTHKTFLSIGQILLMISFAVPFTKKLGLIKLSRYFHIENIIIPFVRVGGIECIVQKK